MNTPTTYYFTTTYKVFLPRIHQWHMHEADWAIFFLWRLFKQCLIMNLHGTFLTLSFMLRTMCNLAISIAIFDHFTCHTYFQWCTTVGTLLCEAIGTTATGHDRRRCQYKRSICSRMMVDNYQLDRHQVFTLVLMYGGLSVVRVRPRTLLSIVIVLA